MKSSKSKTMPLLLCCASLLPLIALNLWLEKHRLSESAKVLPLLVALIFPLGLYSTNALFREKTPPKISDGTTTAPSTFIGSIIGQGEALFPLLKAWTRLLIMGIIWTIAFRINLSLSFLLLCLAPLDILSHKLLCQELIWRSSRAFSSFKELAIARQHRHSLAATPHKHAPIYSKALHYLSVLAKAAISVLAVANYILQDCNPQLLALYAILLPLFFSSLGVSVYGNLCRQDLINSINYLKQMQGDEELNSCQ